VADPALAFAPVHAPEAAQVFALVDDQVKVAFPRGATAVGLADSVIVGAGTTVIVTLRVVDPVRPVQVKVNLVV
jgi:hypothetical protein